MMQRCAIMVAFSIENAKKIYILFTQIGKISSFILLNWRDFCDGICQQTDEIMRRLTNIWKHLLMVLCFSMVQLRCLLAQTGQDSGDDYPLNPSPLRVVLYIILSFVVIAVVFKLLYKPRKKNQP